MAHVAGITFLFMSVKLCCGLNLPRVFLRKATQRLSGEPASDSGEDSGGLQEEDSHHDRGDEPYHKAVKLFAGKSMAACFHLIHNPLRLQHPAHEDAGQQGDEGHQEAVADIIHQIKKLRGLTVGQRHFKIEQVIAQADHSGGSGGKQRD